MKGKNFMDKKKMKIGCGLAGGFTLVELIVVLVILSVVSAIAVPSVLGYIDDGKAKECKSRLNALAADIATAKLSYEVDGEEDGDKFGHDKIQEYINNAGEDGKCPLGDTYEAVEDTQIKCPKGHAICNIEDAGSFSVAKLEVEENTEKRESPDSTATPPEETTPTPDNTGEDTDPTPTPTPVVHTYSVRIEPDSLDMETGETESLQVTVYDEKGNKVPEEQIKDVTWTFPANGFVQGTESGKMAASVEAQAAGSGEIQCTVTIVDENRTTSTSKGSVKVTVEDSKPQLQLDVSPVPSVEVGKDVEIEASVKDAEGNPYTGTDVTVTYRSEGPNIAQVDPSTGEVHGVAPGECDVTVTLKDKAGNVLDEKTVKVKVTDPEPKTQPSVELSVPESVDLEKGKGEEITASATSKGLDGKDVKYTYEWESKDASVKVDKTSEDGSTVTVTGETAREYDITCKVTGTYTDENGNQQTVTDEKTIRVNVEEPQTETQPQPELDLEVPPLTVEEGEEGKLEPKATGGSGKYTFEYESQDKTIVTVDENGTVTGGNPGKTKVKVTVTDTDTGATKTVEVEVNVTEGGLFNPHTFQVWTTDAASVKLQNDEVFKRNLDNLPPGTWSLVSGDIDSPSFFGNGEVNLFPKHYMDGDEQSCATDFVLKYVTYDGREDEITVKIGYPINFFTNILDKEGNASEAIFGVVSDPLYTSDVPFTWEVEPKPDSETVEWDYANERHTKIKVKKSPNGQCKFRVRVHTTRQKTGEEVWSAWREITIEKKKEITNVTLSPSPLTLKAGETAMITATPEYDNSSVDVSKVTYNFSSWNTSQTDGNVIEVQPGGDTATVKGLKAGNAVIKVDVSYNYVWMTSAQCDVIVEEETEETEETALPENEVEIYGERFGAMSWKEFQKNVLSQETYKANKNRGKENASETVLLYDVIAGKRVLYIVMGNGTDFKDSETPVGDIGSFEAYMSQYKEARERLVKVDLENIIDIDYEKLETAGTVKSGYSEGTVVRVKTAKGYEYYVAYDHGSTKTQLSSILKEQTDTSNCGWWKLNILS